LLVASIRQRSEDGPLMHSLKGVDEAKTMVAAAMEAYVAAVVAALGQLEPMSPWWAATVAALADPTKAAAAIATAPSPAWIPAATGQDEAAPGVTSWLGLEPLEASNFIARLANASALISDAVHAAAPALGSAAWAHHAEDAVSARVQRLKALYARLLIAIWAQGA